MSAPTIACIGTSNPGAFRVDLCSRVGADDAGRQVLSQSVDTSLATISDRRLTVTYTAILEPNGELVLGVADMAVYDELTPAVVMPALDRLREASFWFLDAGLPPATLARLLDAAGPIPTAGDAVSVAKSQRLTASLPRIPYLFCNVARASAILGDAPADGLAAGAQLSPEALHARA